MSNKWNVTTESVFHGRVYYDDASQEWKVKQKDATEFSTYIDAELCAAEVGGEVREVCPCTTTEPVK